MSSQLGDDEEVLSRLIREAGDPSVSPDSKYAETLRTAILNQLGSAEAGAHVAERRRNAGAIPISVERGRLMKRIAQLAAAATILAAFGTLIMWLTIGNASDNVAFAQVAKALDSLHSATFDIKSGAKGNGGQSATAIGKGYFLAPSHLRTELSTETSVNSGKIKVNLVTIVDGQEAKVTTLSPDQKIAVTTDTKAIEDVAKQSGNGVRPDLFEMVRRLVRERDSGAGEDVERLANEVIDGHDAAVYRLRDKTIGGLYGDMTLWADLETARPIRIELTNQMFTDVHLVMDNFRYDVDLDPSLFSLEPPEGYSTVAIDIRFPAEEDFLSTLRMIAGQSAGLFPATLEMPKTISQPAAALDASSQEALQAEIKKIMAKYGGADKFKGKDLPPGLMDEVMKLPIMQKLAQDHWQEQTPLWFKQWNGMNFYVNLRPENDPHYVGAGVRLGTLDRPIFWYKPAGADKYRVIYADLSVKEMTLDDIQKLPIAADE